MTLGALLACTGVVVVQLGGLAWVFGATQTGRRLLLAGVLMVVVGPGIDCLLAEVGASFTANKGEILGYVALAVGLVLFVRIFGARPRETKLSHKRRVDEDR